MRFPGFTDEWKRTPLNQMVERVTRKNTGEESNIALTISAQYGLVDQESFFNNKVASSDLSHYYLLYKGDYAYNKSYSSGYPWGAVKRLNMHEKGAVSTLYICFHPFDTVDSDFIGHYFESSRWHKGVSEIAVEGARNHGLLNIGVKDFFNTVHFIPSLPEQKKIAKLLTLIDERINIQSKIIDNYLSFLKGLTKTLTHRGEPNTRISDSLECHTSTLQEGGLNESGKYPVYGASGIAGYLDEYKCNEDAILVIKDGSGVGTVSYATGEYSVIGTLNYLTAKSRYSLKYLYFCLMGFNFEPFKTGMAIPHIYFRDYGQVKIYCPSIQEQEHIAKALTTIENKINIEKQLLKSLYMEKQYLLNKMFI